MTQEYNIPRTRDDAIAMGREYYSFVRPSGTVMKVAISKRIALALDWLHHFDEGVICERDPSHGGIKQASTGRCSACERLRLKTRNDEIKEVNKILYNMDKQDSVIIPVVEPIKVELDFIELNIQFEEHDSKKVPRFGQTWEVDGLFKTWVIEYEKFDPLLLPYVRWNSKHYTDSTTLREHFKYNEADKVNGTQCKSAEMNGIRYYWIHRNLITPLAQSSSMRLVRVLTSAIIEKIIEIPAYLPNNLVKQHIEHNPSLIEKHNIDEMTLTFDDIIIESL